MDVKGTNVRMDNIFPHAKWTDVELKMGNDSQESIVYFELYSTE